MLFALVHGSFARGKRGKDAGERLTEIERDDGRRCFCRAETVVVSDVGAGIPQEFLIFVHAAHQGGHAHEEERIVFRLATGLEEVLARVGGKRPVDVLAASGHACKRLFVQETGKRVTLCHAAHRLHDQMVVITGDVRGGIDHGKLVLGRRHFVVLGLGKHAERPKFFIQLVHEGGNAQTETAAIMVVQFLSLRRLGAKERSAADHQIHALFIKLAIDQEIFLFGSDHRGHDLRFFIPQGAKHAHGGAGNRVHGAQKRRFLIKCFSRIRAEHARDIKRLVEHEGRRGEIPRGVSARFKGGAQTARRETGGVRFSADKLLARELQNRLTVFIGRQKRIVLAGGDLTQRLEPMRKMRRSLGNRPIFHDGGNFLRHGRGQCLTAAACGKERLPSILAQALLHHIFGKKLFSERNFF